MKYVISNNRLEDETERCVGHITENQVHLELAIGIINMIQSIQALLKYKLKHFMIITTTVPGNIRRIEIA